MNREEYELKIDIEKHVLAEQQAIVNKLANLKSIAQEQFTRLEEDVLHQIDIENQLNKAVDHKSASREVGFSKSQNEVTSEYNSHGTPRNYCAFSCQYPIDCLFDLKRLCFWTSYYDPETLTSWLLHYLHFSILRRRLKPWMFFILVAIGLCTLYALSVLKETDL
jgi:hypothetical protein